MQEYRNTLTKDLSKSYQLVESDELAQHKRRMIWHGSDLQQETSVYITTSVNFGDKLTGCIAIAPTQEIERLFGGDKKEAAWFLKERTCVDDGTSSADTWKSSGSCPKRSRR
jgi:hypothetical protein